MKPYLFLELDDITRAFMRNELDRDVCGPTVSKCFTSRGHGDYPALLGAALAGHDAAWLIAELQQHDRMTETPVNAAERFGGTEFNRYYVRAVCRRALAHRSNEVKVYRARESSSKRSGSEKLIDGLQPATTLLDDLRTNREGTAMGIALVTSGLSVRCGCGDCLQATT